MANNSYIKAVLVRAALEFAPPLIRETLLEDATFRKTYGIKADGLLSFADFGVSVRRSVLFSAVRSVFLGKPEVKVPDTRGRKWKVKRISGEGSHTKFSLTRGKQQLILPNLCALSPDQAIRLCSFDEAAFDVNLPKSAQTHWRDVLAERALEDEEIATYRDEFRETPVYKARSIHSQIIDGKSSIADLVPTSLRYFERLVGAYDGSVTIGDYATGCWRRFSHELSAWKPYEGFLFSLLLSSHSFLSAEINVDRLSTEELMRAFDFLEKQGDRISQLGAIEIGLRVLSSRPEIEPNLIRLIELLRDDDATGLTSGFKLLSALFTLVDGELSSNRLLAGKPPFYRRLASLAQAALIQRQLMNSGININRFCEWALSQRGGEFFLQSLTDMRTEPRWYPLLSAATQVREDFLGRIMIAAKKHEQNIKGGKLFDLALGSAAESVQSHADFLCPYFPGPLEGAQETQNILPAEIAATIKTQLQTKEASPSSFIALVNSALIFSLGMDEAALAADALRLGNYRLAHVEDKQQLLSILNGLATVAAVTRCAALADDLRILVRRYRRDAQYMLSIPEAIGVCLVAAASRACLNDWREFVGDWLTELAFGDLEGDESEILYWYLQRLCHIVPELWVPCGRADAALMAYNASR